MGRLIGRWAHLLLSACVFCWGSSVVNGVQPVCVCLSVMKAHGWPFDKTSCAIRVEITNTIHFHFYSARFPHIDLLMVLWLVHTKIKFATDWLQTSFRLVKCNWVTLV